MEALGVFPRQTLLQLLDAELEVEQLRNSHEKQIDKQRSQLLKKDPMLNIQNVVYLMYYQKKYHLFQNLLNFHQSGSKKQKFRYILIQQ